MTRPDKDPEHDPSVEFEPHFAPYLQPAPQMESPAPSPLRGGLGRGQPNTGDPKSPERRAVVPIEVDHSVWEEPTLAPILAAGFVPADQVTYARWLEERIAATTNAKSLFVTLLLVLCAGPLGVFGVFFNAGAGGGVTIGGLLAVVLFGPVTEEMTKIMLALWIVEKKPYLFKFVWQPLVAAAAGGLFFAVIENLIYLHVYIPHPSKALADFRWTICTMLHVTCSLAAGVGLARMWEHTMRNRVRPEMAKGVPWFVLAMASHGLYNLTVTIAEVTGMLKLD